MTGAREEVLRLDGPWLDMPVNTDGGATTTREKARFGWPVYAWGLWDWGSAAFNAVITTFVFSVYITSDSFGPGASSKLGWARVMDWWDGLNRPQKWIFGVILFTGVDGADDGVEAAGG